MPSPSLQWLSPSPSSSGPNASPQGMSPESMGYESESESGRSESESESESSMSESEFEPESRKCGSGRKSSRVLAKPEFAKKEYMLTQIVLFIYLFILQVTLGFKAMKINNLSFVVTFEALLHKYMHRCAEGGGACI